MLLSEESRAFIEIVMVSVLWSVALNHSRRSLVFLGATFHCTYLRCYKLNEQMRLLACWARSTSLFFTLAFSVLQKPGMRSQGEFITIRMA